MLDDVLELTDVAGPAEGQQPRLRLGVDRGELAIQALVQPSHEKFRERQNVFAALPQGRQVDRKHAEPVEQIGAEPPLPHSSLEAAIGRRNQPHVDPPGLRGAQPLERALLDDTQQRDLHLGREFANLVEKQRAGICQFEAADSSHRCAGECTRFVSEELGGNDRFRNRARLTAVRGRAARRDRRWTTRAITSFPVPVSPSSSTVVSTRATQSTQSSTCRSAGDRVTTPSSSHQSSGLLEELNRSVAEVVMSAPPSRREPPTDGCSDDVVKSHAAETEGKAVRGSGLS